MPKKRSVEDVIAALAGARFGKPMWLLTIPERADVDKLIDANVPARSIVEWLSIDCGHGEEATIGRLKNYIASGRQSKVSRHEPIASKREAKR